MALYIVATPLGTLDDLAPRARELLARVPLIVCEDTRRTRALLNAVDIPAPQLIALHAHNESFKSEGLVSRCRTQDVVLTSDAGTPAISDPGRALVAACHERGVEVRSVPGPSALPSALALSGFPAIPSTFLGFSPRKGLAGHAASLATRPETLVLFEAPNRVPRLLQHLAEAMPHRDVAVCREISKRFEEVLRGPLPQLAAELADAEVRGECVVVIGPGEAVEAAQADLRSDRIKDVAAALADRWGVKKRDVYRGLLALEEALAEDA